MSLGGRYVMQAIKGSPHVTYNIDEADVVFVNTYCYYIWWLGWVHTKGREPDQTPGDYLIAALTGDTSAREADMLQISHNR